MTVTNHPSMQQRLREYLTALNLREPHRLGAILAPDVRYESQIVFEPLLGRDAVLDHLTRKLQAIAKSDAPTYGEVGSLGGRPCGIAHQDGNREALFLLGLDAEGLIKAIDICVVAPHPSEASASGEFPGLDAPPDLEPAPAAGAEPLPRETRVTVVGFALAERHFSRYAVNHALRVLTGDYPNTETRVYFDCDEDSPEGQALHQAALRHAMVGYPHVGVEVNGRPLLHLHPRDALAKRRVLARFFAPPPHVAAAIARFGGDRFPDGTPVCIDCFEEDYAFLSNFSPSPLEFEGLTFPTVENAFQAAKTTDPDRRRPFTDCTPEDAKRRGRRLELRPDWREVRIDVMGRLLEAKFSREPLRGRLLATGEAVLVKGNWWGDQFWGVSKDQGQNHLGRLLMEVRRQLRP